MRRVFALRGIDKPHAFLVKNGFAASSASNMLKYYPIIFKVRTLEKLCILLNCTPNDLFEWRDDGKGKISDEHALNSLKKEAIGNFTEIVKDLPLEKMIEVKSFLEGLRQEKSSPE